MNRRTLISVLLACLGLSACGTAGPAPPERPGPTYSYVALGDSYAAMGSASAATSGPDQCLRSTDNYPSGVLADPRVTGRDASCQGAVTADILAPRDVGSTVVPAQAEALTASTDLVTLSIGGNDIGFGDVAGCFLAAVHSGRESDCAATWGEPTAGRLADLPARLDQVYRVIGKRSGDARVIATGYLPLLAAGETCTGVEALSDADRAWVVSLTTEINRVVAEAAERNGAEMVLPGPAGSHTGCAAPAQRWVDLLGSETGAFPMHPTPAGQAAMADAVLEKL